MANCKNLGFTKDFYTTTKLFTISMLKYDLIITEKPNAALKIAQALADGKPIKKNIAGIPYYEVTHGNHDLVIGCAVGHLFSVTEREKKGWTYPVFDVKWEQTSKISKGAAYTAKYADALKKLAKDATSFTVATDYDIEGEVIGYNVLKYLCKQKDAKRMKYSTLTRDELRESYDKASKTVDWGQVNAGLTRHELDWYYGINLSRALSLAVKSTGSFKILSSGRVQGPALKMVVDREREISAFIPKPFWQISLQWSKQNILVPANHSKDKFWEQKEAIAAFAKVKDQTTATIIDLKKSEFKQTPPAPFDLTSLQTEAYRNFKIQPKETLEIAQSLYLAGIISYPRTSSQKLPKELNLKKIITQLEKNENYTQLIARLLKETKLIPNEGKKTDPAHPAIHPTGEHKSIKDREAKIYDLIVKRFFACFAEPAIRETVTVTLDVNTEQFISAGSRTTKKGWHDFYAPYVNLEEEELPAVILKETVPIKDLKLEEKQTTPPKRYNPASIIKELERRNLGTKATRASIVDTLFTRGYVNGQPIEATKLGMLTVQTLEKYCPSVLDEELTKHFEEEMDEIREHKKKNEEVLDEAKDVLTKILKKFKTHEKEIGSELLVAERESQEIANTVGKCQKCSDGTLMLRKGKFGRFIACDKYPDCKTTFKLPSNCLVKPSENICEVCKFPMLLIIKKGKQPQDLCINVECKTKQIPGLEEDKTAKLCPKCGKELILRKSMYGAFYGCSGYPNCRTIVRIPKEQVLTDGVNKDDITANGKTELKAEIKIVQKNTLKKASKGAPKATKKAK